MGGMSRRRRWWLGLTLALVAGGVIVWHILAPAGRMEVQLIFIGYTNTPLLAQSASWPSGLGTIELSEALLCATNTGSVPVQLWAAIRLQNLSNTTDFAHPSGLGRTTIVNPGESVTVTVSYPVNSPRWQTEFMYQRHNLADRLYEKAWNTGNPTVQHWMQLLLPNPKEGWAQSGWITNTPPAPANSRFIWTGSKTISIPRAQESDGWVPSMRYVRVVGERVVHERPVFKSSDAIDASRPRGRYHITAPPDLSDIDFSDLSVTKQQKAD